MSNFLANRISVVPLSLVENKSTQNCCHEPISISRLGNMLTVSPEVKVFREAKLFTQFVRLNSKKCPQSQNSFFFLETATEVTSRFVAFSVHTLSKSQNFRKSAYRLQISENIYQIGHLPPVNSKLQLKNKDSL